jgi:hypothetical protein
MIPPRPRYEKEAPRYLRAQMKGYAVRELGITATRNAAKDPDDQFTGTRSFSSSNQFVTMLIRGGVSDSSGVYCFIIRNRLPSGLMSQGPTSFKVKGT